MIQMQDLMSKPMPDFREGSIVKGRILEIRPREVLVDIGYKSEGIIPAAEFDDIESLEVGDEVEQRRHGKCDRDASLKAERDEHVLRQSVEETQR